MAVKLDMRLGDCLDVLPQLAAGSVHCCVTSPPYWGLRDYGVDSQLGLEATPEEYVAKMVEVFRAVRRVLRDDGTLWLNMGDSYVGGNQSGQRSAGAYAADAPASWGERSPRHLNHKLPDLTKSGLKPKDLVGMPWKVAFALQADGWWLRSDIIWAKKNPMPESCTDRPTKSHEYLFLLTKSQRYFYDADAIREPNSEGSVERFGITESGSTAKWNTSNNKRDGRTDGTKSNEAFRDHVPFGRNKRSVWTIATQAFSKAHFATFPEALVLPCILAGTSEEGCCAECGAPWERVVEKEVPPLRDVKSDYPGEHSIGTRKYQHGYAGPEIKTTGWQPGCECPERYTATYSVPCTVLDPFLGSGTTAKVSQQYGRSFVGCELSAEYLELARDRFNQPRLFS